MYKMLFWLLFILIFFSCVYFLSSVIAPFFWAFIVAYFLQPLIGLLKTRYNLSYTSATIIVFIIFISSLILMLTLLIPVLYKELLLFISKISSYKAELNAVVTLLLRQFNMLNPEIATRIADSIKVFLQLVLDMVSSYTYYVWNYALATINFFITLFLFPIILYYFLRDWNNIFLTINSILPINNKIMVKKIFIEINGLVSAYIRGQLNICCIVSIYYAIGIALIGLVDMALFLGILSGFMIILPFIGVFISFLIVSIGFIFLNGFSVKLLYVLLLFIIGQVFEGYILTPRIIGNRIGLHPVWIIFAVLISGSLLGFFGILFAIPIAGIVKIIIKYIINYYKSSIIYNG